MWDSAENLASVRVDSLENFDSFQSTDFVEMRANAFAIAFLAPPSAVEKLHASSENIADCLYKIISIYGISLTAAKLHLKNILDISCENLTIHRDIENIDEWKGRELFTSEYFPIPSTPIERRGLFAKLAIIAYGNNLLSKDTLASYLKAPVATIDQKMNYLKSIYEIKSN
mgnify:CR=1 FL=1